MDNNGDSRFEFDPGDRAAVAEAMERFKELTALGYKAAERIASETARKMTQFDPAAEPKVLLMWSRR